MEKETSIITDKIKFYVFLVLTIPTITAAVVGYGAFKHFHTPEEIQIEDAKITGTLVSVRTLVDGKVMEILFEDGDEVKAGDVIARLEVEVNADVIAQLEDTVELAKENYEDLKRGQTVKVPVKKVRMIPAKPSANSTTKKDSSLASLEERANRMKELFEMGAISKTQRDAAVAEYERAKANAPVSPVPAQNSATYVEEIEYIDQWQPTPPAVLQNAENAIKQAELSLNVALQEAQENEVIAPISGAIYYTAEVDKELIAGNSIAKIGDSNELWLAAEVPEDIFNKVSLGKPVDYVLAEKNLSGTVIEKIAPNIREATEIENFPAWIPPTAEDPHPEFKIDKEENFVDERPNDKYILKFSLPAERDFECKPNTSTNVKVKIF